MMNDILYDELEETQFKVPENVINKIIGLRLKERRTAMRLNQGELGKRLGVSGQQVHKYESGLDRIPISKICELVNILQVPVNYFFEDLEQEGLRESQGEEYQALPPEQLQFQKYIDIYKEFSDPKLQKMLVEVTKLFANQLKILDVAAPRPTDKKVK